MARYRMNEHYFDVIDSPDKAYWLGFIWCDGYVAKRVRNSWISYEFKLSLSDVDEKHLRKCIKSFDSNHVIRNYECITGFKTKNKESRLFIANKYFGETLYEKYGIKPHRTDFSYIINKVPDKFVPDLIRGVLDGDGCITEREVKYKKTNRKEFSISFTTNTKVLDFINEYLIRKGFTNTRYLQSRRHSERDGDAKTLRITGNIIVYKILSLLYGSNRENIVYLDRKYAKYKEIDSYMLNYKNENGGFMNAKSKIV